MNCTMLSNTEFKGQLTQSEIHGVFSSRKKDRTAFADGITCDFVKVFRDRYNFFYYKNNQ